MTCLFVLGPVLTGCGDKGTTPPGQKGSTGSTAPAAVDEPLPGVDLAALPPASRPLFFAAVDHTQSPCGKPHSLRTSLKTDPECPRARVAALRLVGAIKSGARSVDELVAIFEQRYGKPPLAFDLTGVPFSGPADAPVKIVEFFDFNCPHCKERRSMVAEVMGTYPGKVAFYYMMYPLGAFPLSEEAAQAALAANLQGKYSEMATLIFEHQGQLAPTSFTDFAKQIGLDLAKFTADMAAAGPAVDFQRQQGAKAQVMSTPEFFVNGYRARKTELRDLRDLIDEELLLVR